jgi:WD40 repeat protein
MVAMIQKCHKCGRELSLGFSSETCPECIFDFAVMDSDSAGLKVAHAGCGERSVFGDYELLEEIARGGMGVVYKARQISLRRVVALKMILAGQFAGKQMTQRFRGEAAAAGTLQHPNIVAIHEIGMHEGQHYFSMDYVEGQNLAELVTRQPLSPKKAAHYVKLIAEAIHYAHEQGILHRDLKPSNILIDSATDQPRITDFGLAKRMGGESSLTLTGQLLGSPHFMPPEQASGERGKVGRHSDVYALGGILFYLLTGRAPFQGETLEKTINLVLNTEPISPKLMNPEVPRDLETICLKCLEKDPPKRYSNARAMAEELSRFLKGESIVARPVGPFEKSWRWCQRKPMLATFSMALVVLVLTVAIGSPIAAYRINRARVELRRNLYIADMNVASQALREQHVGRAKELVDMYLQPKPGAEDMRGVEWRYLWRQCQPNDARVFSGHSGVVTCAIFSPDGKLLVTAGAEGVLRVWDGNSGNLLRSLLGFDDMIDMKAVAFSPDGKWLAAKGGTKIRAWRTENWEEAEPPIDGEPNSNNNNALCFSRVGEMLLTHIPGGIGFIELKGWQTNGLLIKEGERSAVERSSSGNWLLGTLIEDTGKFFVTSRWHELEIRDHQDPAKIVARLKRSDGNSEMRVLSIAISTNYIVAGYRDGVITVWELGSWREVAAAPLHRSFLEGLAFSPDGRLLASGGVEHVIQIWDFAALINRGSGGRAPIPALTLRGHTELINALTFSQDGHQLLSASSDGTARLWDMPARLRSPVLPGSQFPLWFSDDGQRFIALDRDGQVHQWDLAGRSDSLGPKVDESHERLNSISRDGSLLAFAKTNETIAVSELKRGASSRIIDPKAEKILALAFSPSPGRPQLAVLTATAGIWSCRLWPVTNGTSVSASRGLGDGPIIEAHRGISLKFSDDGKLLAIANVSRSIQLINVDRSEGYELGPVPDTMELMAFSPGGTALAAATSGGPVHFWDLATGSEGPVLKVPAPGAAGVAFSRDEKTLLTCDWDGQLRFWDARLHKELMAIPSFSPMRFSLMLSRDGNSLAFPSREAMTDGGDIQILSLPSLEEIDKFERGKRAPR